MTEHAAEYDAFDELAELVAVHTPDVVNLAADGIREGQHDYCVECGVLPSSEAGPKHVARVIVSAGYRRVISPARTEGDNA